MAITQSAKKAHRASLKKAVFNARRKDALRDATKGFLKSVSAKNASEAAKLLPAAYQAIDKAAKRGVIKKNTADRKKARLAAALAKLGK